MNTHETKIRNRNTSSTGWDLDDDHDGTGSWNPAGLLPQPSAISMGLKYRSMIVKAIGVDP